MTSTELILLPAYGRDYHSREAVLKDWEADKDFTLASTGQKINKSDYLEFAPHAQVKFRYSKKTKSFYLNPTGATL